MKRCRGKEGDKKNLFEGSGEAGKLILKAVSDFFLEAQIHGFDDRTLT